MAEETHYTANTGMATISTANPNLDGTGTLGTIITGAANGTLIKSISIKAQGSSGDGMIRLFVYDAVTAKLFMEIPVPDVKQATDNPAFETQVILNMTLQSGYSIKASTQTATTFNIIAEGMDWEYYTTSVRADTTQLTVNNNRASISTANNRLDGTGAVSTAFTAGSSATYKGASIRSITIKSTVTVSSGMIRIFLQNGGGSKFLFTEVYVDTEAKSGVHEAFERTITFDDDFDLQAGYSILASTEVAENFRILVEGTDWNYAS